ncbi:MAG TPA: NifU family protein [Polyangiaceae bacterium]
MESRSRQVGSKTDPELSGSPDPDATGPNTAVMTLSDAPPRGDEDVLAGLTKVSREVLAPLVAADGGVMYLVKASAEEVHFHLTGTCAGCPGAALTRDGMIVPAVRTVLPKARVIVTTGFRVPEGSTKVL